MLLINNLRAKKHRHGKKSLKSVGIFLDTFQLHDAENERIFLESSCFHRLSWNYYLDTEVKDHLSMRWELNERMNDKAFIQH